MTQCLRPLAPTNEELLRHALDGEALSVAAREHLDHCDFCQLRLKEYTSTNNLMLSHLYRSQCPDATRLSHYCAGMLSAEEATRVADHLDICPLCANDVAETRLFLATFEPFPQTYTPAPGPHDAVLHAHRIPWQPQPTIQDNDGYEQVHPWPRQYQADTICISLHLARDKQDAVLLLGLLSNMNVFEYVETISGAKVELYRAYDSAPFSAKGDSLGPGCADIQGPLLSTHVDELGRIVFRSVPAGRYLMIIYLPETEVVIEELDISFH